MNKFFIIFSFFVFLFENTSFSFEKQIINKNKTDKSSKNIVINNDNFNNVNFNSNIDTKGRFLKKNEIKNKKLNDTDNNIKGSVYVNINLNNEKPEKNIRVGGTIDRHHKINDKVSFFTGIETSGCVNCEDNNVFSKKSIVNNQSDMLKKNTKQEIRKN